MKWLKINKLEKHPDPNKFLNNQEYGDKPINYEKASNFIDWWQNVVHGNNMTQAQYERAIRRL